MLHSKWFRSQCENCAYRIGLICRSNSSGPKKLPGMDGPSTNRPCSSYRRKDKV